MIEETGAAVPRILDGNRSRIVDSCSQTARKVCSCGMITVSPVGHASWLG